MDNKHKTNSFDKDINNLKEWQDHQYDPGYYIGTGRVPRHVTELGKRTTFLMVLGFIHLFIGLSILFASKAFLPAFFLLSFAALFFYRGIYNLRQNKKKRG